MREEPFFHANQECQRKLQPLGRVQRHQRDARAFFVLISIAHKRSMIEELAERLAAIGRVTRSIH